MRGWRLGGSLGRSGRLRLMGGFGLVGSSRRYVGVVDFGEASWQVGAAVSVWRRCWRIAGVFSGGGGGLRTGSAGHDFGDVFFRKKTFRGEWG